MIKLKFKKVKRLVRGCKVSGRATVGSRLPGFKAEGTGKSKCGAGLRALRMEQWVALNWGVVSPFRGHLAMSGDIFGYLKGWGRLLLASCG